MGRRAACAMRTSLPRSGIAAGLFRAVKGAISVFAAEPRPAVWLDIVFLNFKSLRIAF
jgi:hypothetical protein